MTRRADETGARVRAREVLRDASLLALPVDLEALAASESLHISILDGLGRGQYGAFCYRDNVCEIVISPHCPTDGHRRFTLAHELGHYFLDGHIDEMFAGGGQVVVSGNSHFRGQLKPWYEREADAFAAELLAPFPLVHKLIVESQPGLRSIQQLATTCQTSLSCAAIQYAACCREPLAVLLSHNGALEWASMSESLRAHTWARRPLRGEWVPPRSATKQWLRPPSGLSYEPLVFIGKLAEWFEQAPDVDATEEALLLGDYGRVLTVLTCSDLQPPEVYEQRTRRSEQGATWTSTMRSWRWDSYEDSDED